MISDPYILLVEDNPGDIRLVQAMFEDAPAGTLPQLRLEQSVRAAAACLSTRPGCQALLLDLSLPDSHGLETLAMLRDLAGNAPIVVLSGNYDENVGLSAVINGAQDYLVKGAFDASLLRRALQYALHRKRVEQELIKRAMHDPLTGLPSKTVLLDRLRVVLNSASRSGNKGALLFIDLDKFKQVNDTYGHAVGDQVLIACAQRMLGAIRSSDTVSRIGGDEFIVMLPMIGGGDDDGQAVAEKILRALRQPMDLDGCELVISASIGLVNLKPGLASAEDLIARADEAMYVAKRTGGATVQ